MIRKLLTAGLVLTIAGLISAAAPPQPGLTPFESEDALRAFLGAGPQSRGDDGGDEEDGSVSALVITGSRIAKSSFNATTPIASISGETSESITNTQEAGVDEGDIVKARGDILVILRRGRLFTVSTAGGRLRPVAHIDAYPPGVNGAGGWYDEMLVAGDHVAVIGYSYTRGGTELNRFKLDAQGRLTFVDSHHLRSADYYSSRNYASRLIGSRLIMYTALPLRWGNNDALSALPGMRRWDPKAPGGFRRIATPQDVFVAPDALKNRTSVQAVHSVTTCDLAAAELDCKAQVVLGPYSQVFYVSNTAVYLWTSDAVFYGDRQKAGSNLLYRMPLEGGRPSAIKVSGMPTDQFSFDEDSAGGQLNVVVRPFGWGDGMWGADAVGVQGVALARIPLSRFGDGSASLETGRYRSLPMPYDRGAFQNRFVGDHLIYGLGDSWGGRDERGGTIYATAVEGGPVSRMPVPHGIDRIEVMGPDAVVIGSTLDAVWFSTVELGRGRQAHLGDRYRLGGAAEAESRSHGFFYKPDRDSADGTAGIIGLPVARPARPAYRQLFETSASMVFLQRRDRRFRPLGQLPASDTGAVDDGCVASCVDWYGNARPIFLGGRVYALMGYELVEGRVGRYGIREVGRTSFAPGPEPKKR